MLINLRAEHTVSFDLRDKIHRVFLVPGAIEYDQRFHLRMTFSVPTEHFCQEMIVRIIKEISDCVIDHSFVSSRRSEYDIVI